MVRSCSIESESVDGIVSRVEVAQVAFFALRHQVKKNVGARGAACPAHHAVTRIQKQIGTRSPGKSKEKMLLC
jgi:hypothetical protein